MVACERSIPNLSTRCGGDPIGAESFPRLPCLHLAGGGIDASVYAALTGKPQNSFAIESRSVEVCTREFFGQWEELHRLGFGIKAGNCILTAFGDPCGPIRTNDYAMRRRSGSERDLSDLAGFWVENTDRALMLRCVPHSAVGGRRNIVGMGAMRDIKVAPLGR